MRLGCLTCVPLLECARVRVGRPAAVCGAQRLLWLAGRVLSDAVAIAGISVAAANVVAAGIASGHAPLLHVWKASVECAVPSTDAE